MNNITAEVHVDAQHGPLVVVTCDTSTVVVYLMDETGTLIAKEGHVGINVSGPWTEFKAALRLL